MSASTFALRYECTYLLLLEISHRSRHIVDRVNSAIGAIPVSLVDLTIDVFLDLKADLLFDLPTDLSSNLRTEVSYLTDTQLYGAVCVQPLVSFLEIW